MPTPFHVGMCNYDGSPNNPKWARLGWIDRLGILRSALNWFLPPILNANELYCFIAPEFFFGAVAQDKKTWTSLSTALGRISTANNFLLVGGSTVAGTGSSVLWKKGRYYNRVPIWYGGQFMEYKKRENAGEVGTTKYKHYRAGETPNTFDMTINGSTYHFGVEVCADHARGHLQQDGVTVDVQIIVANSVQFDNNHIVADQYALLCNPASDFELNTFSASDCRVWDCNNNTAVASNADKSYRWFRWDLQLN